MLNYVQASSVYISLLNAYDQNGGMRLFGSRLLAEPEGLVTTVESNKLRPEHNVTVDLETRTLVSLDTTEAGRVCCINSREGDLATGNLGHVIANGDTHIGQLSIAGVDETTDLGVKLSTLDLRVVCLGDLLVDEEERCTGVGNSVRTLRVLEKLVTDSKLGRWELPEARLGLDGYPCHWAFELCGINLAERIGAAAIWVEIGSEDRHVQVGHNVVEKCLCGSLLGAVIDSVELGEGKTDETVSVGILDEGLGDSTGKLDSLSFDLDASDGNGISANGTGGTGTISVADLPCRARSLLEGSGL